MNTFKKNLFAIAFFMVLLLFPLGCGQFASPQSEGPVGGFGFNPGDDRGGSDFEILNVILNLYPTGFFPNRITISGNFAYIVNSGSNAIQRLHLENGFSESNFITLPPGSNPWEMAVSGSKGYITNFITNTVSVANMATGAPITTIFPNGSGDLVTPEGIAIADNGLVFVANPNIEFGKGGTIFNDGFITVIDSATDQIINEIPTTQKNPQFVKAIGNTVYVTNSGEFQFDFECFCFAPVTDGGIDILDANLADTANAPQDNIPIPLDPVHPLRGIPGGFGNTQDNSYAYLGSNGGIMYKVDLLSRTLLRGNSNPIIVTADSTDNLLTVKSDNRGVIWVLSFNEDRAYLLDPDTDQVSSQFISLDSDHLNLEGPLDLAFHNNGEFPDPYIVMTISEEISVIFTN